MTIVRARVDKRLIHGQVAVVWVNTVGAQRIMVINDAAVKDQLQIGALRMAKPTGVKLSILSKRRAIGKISASNCDEEKVFLITKDTADMAVPIGDDVPLQSFSVGNISQKKSSRVVEKSVALTDEDIQTVRCLIDNGVTITAQMIPSEPSEAILTFIR